MSASCMRLSAVAIAGLIAVAVRDDTRWQSVVLSLGFGHYLLSLWYARRKFSCVASNWNTTLPMLAALAGGTALYLGRFPLVVYFAVHHVFNEVYVSNDMLKKLNVTEQKLYRASAIVLQTLLYFYLLRNEPPVQLLNDRMLLSGLILAYVFYLSVLIRLRKSLTVSDLLELATFEMAALAVLAVSFIVPIRFLDVVCYHFVFWWFYPASKIVSQGATALWTYVLQTAVLISISYLVSPAGLIGDYPFRDSVYLKQFILWSHIHITTSFFLSAAHPAWIRRWFTQRDATARSAEPELRAEAAN